MPFLALLRNDLHSLLTSWLVRIWLAAAVALTLLLAATAWRHYQTAPLIASLLFPWLVFPWFVVVMVLGVNPMSSSRGDSLADGYLSRPITRYEYLWAIWGARVTLVWGVFLLVNVPTIAVAALANRSVAADRVTWYGITAALAVVGLVLTLQVSLAFLVGILVRKTLPAVVILLFLWYPLNGLLSTFQLEAFSPISLNQALPTLLRQPWREDRDPAAPNRLEMEELAQQTSSFLSFFSSGGAPEPPPRRTAFFERDEFPQFSLTKVLLSYGLPTLASLALATVCFSRRDV